MRRLPIVVLAAAVSASIAAGCVDENPGLVVAGNIQPDDMCVFSPSGAALVAYGVYDVAFPHSYFVAPKFLSGLVSRTAVPGPPMAEPNNIAIEGAVVELTAVGGASLPIATSSYTVAMSAFVPPSVDGDPGTATGIVEAIPASVGEEIKALLGGSDGTVIARMTFFGHTTGGTAIDAGPWSWTMRVCDGCLEVPCATMLTSSCLAGQDGNVYKGAACVVP